MFVHQKGQTSIHPFAFVDSLGQSILEGAKLNGHEYSPQCGISVQFVAF
jgi:hypothetical protein